jgi:hypothetical protein
MQLVDDCMPLVGVYMQFVAIVAVNVSRKNVGGDFCWIAFG